MFTSAETQEQRWWSGGLLGELENSTLAQMCGNIMQSVEHITSQKYKQSKYISPPCCIVDGSTFSPADRDTKKAKGTTQRQMVK